MKELIVAEPWISAILRGDKTWEMRKRNCKVRGQIALIRKGSGQVVGTADIVNCRSPITKLADYAAAEPYHRIPNAQQPQAFAIGWRIPWELANARPLQKPVPYKHQSGAVTWVKLEPDVAAKVQAQSMGADTEPFS
jgi:ASCH domain